MTLTRRLCYGDKWVWQIVQETIAPDASGVIAFPDQSTPVVLSLELSQEQYTKILSCVVVGSELAFPEESHQIQNDFLMMMEGSAMSCDDVADCIDTSEAVLASLLSQLAANGFAPSGNGENSPTNVTMSPSQAAENLLPATYSCDDGQMMATARTVVKKFDEFTQDLFDQVELLTNPLEVVDITSDGIPVADSLGNVAAFADFVAQTVRETYQASYNNAAENEIACAIYCAMKTDCLLSYDMLIDVYNDLQVVEYPAPSDMNDFQAVVGWLMGLDLQVGVATVAAFHLLLAVAMRFGSGAVFEMSGLVGLKTVIAGTVGLRDDSWTECACAEETAETYWMLYKDFRLGLGDWVLNQGEPTANGIQSLTYASQARAGVQLNNLGNEFKIAAAGVRSQRRGSVGNGTNDFARYWAYPNINLGGTASGILSEAFITCNTNDCDNQNKISPIPATLFESLYIQISVDGSHVYPTNFCRIIDAVVYGECNGTAKPPNSVYVASIPSDGFLFPDQVEP